MKTKYHPLRLIGFLSLACLTMVLPIRAQNAAPADRNAINTTARPGGMMADSPMTFPKEGALPAKYPPDVRTQSEPVEKDYYLFSSPCRSLAQIATIQKEMPQGQFTPPPPDWKYLQRVRRLLTEGGELRLLALGDSIVNDTMRSGWVAKLQEAYPQAAIHATVYVRGGGGCQHYKDQDRIASYVLPRKPDLVFIGGISQRDIASIREVIHQLRAGRPEVEILLATGAFGTADPRDADALAKASHSGTGAYGQALKGLAAEERCAYLDLTSPWAEYIRSSKLHPHLFYRDAVHANEYGEQILAKILMAFWTTAPREGARAAEGGNDLALRSLVPPVLMPDGVEFKTWEQPLRFSKTYYVDGANPEASDTNPGTSEHPFATINHAAQVLQPGERVVIAAGVYRECVRPARGGSGPDQMISYEAAPGATVVMKGSRPFKTNWQPSADAAAAGIVVWQARLDPSLFSGYNPFAIDNVTPEQFAAMDWATPLRGKPPYTLPRGLVFQDGKLLRQVASATNLLDASGAYWVDRPNQLLLVRLAADQKPAEANLEITTQESVFAPVQSGLGFIRVKGLTLEQAAGPFPWEQVGILSTTRGHHWIIEDNVVRWANGVGIDLGIQHPRRPQPPIVGFHIVRRNVVTDCGICGICGLGPGGGREFGLLIEDNVLRRNAFYDVERLYETGAIKTHNNIRCLIRHNLIVDTRHGAGIWMDWNNQFSRCTGNLIIGTHTIHGGIFVEASYRPNLIDQNIIWNTEGHGIYEHDSTGQLFCHNLIAHSTKCGLHLHGRITDRRVDGRVMTYGRHTVKNNILIENRQSNVFFGEPSELANNIDQGVTAQLDSANMILTWKTPASGILCQPVPGITRDLLGQPRMGPETCAGPFAQPATENKPFQLWTKP